MVAQDLERIIDGDGHVMEDIQAIIDRLPEAYRSDSAIRDPFPPIDHLHSSNKHKVPDGAFAPVGVEGWKDFFDRSLATTDHVDRAACGGLRKADAFLGGDDRAGQGAVDLVRCSRTKDRSGRISPICDFLRRSRIGLSGRTQIFE